MIDWVCNFHTYTVYNGNTIKQPICLFSASHSIYNLHDDVIANTSSGVTYEAPIAIDFFLVILDSLEELISSHFLHHACHNESLHIMIVIIHLF